MFSQEGGRRLGQLVVDLVGRLALPVLRKDDAAQHIALGQDGGGSAHMERGPVGAEGNGLGSRLVLIDLTALHQPLQLRGDLLVLDLTPGGAGDGHAVVPIGDDCDLAGGAADGLTQLAGELGHAPHEGILFEDDPAVPVRVDFQRVTVIDNIGMEHLVRTPFCGLDDGNR